MKVAGKAYASVSELVHDSGNSEFAAEFEAYQSERRLVNCLTTIRCVNEIGQVELSERMGCTQSKVSRMETSRDADLNFGDIVAYARGLKQTVHLMFSPESMNAVDHIRFHFSCINGILESLISLAGDDEVICNGVERVAVGFVQGAVAAVEQTLDRLPHRIQPRRPPVSIEVQGQRGSRLAIESPKRTQRTKKETIS
jgi:hypothetical protein